MCHQIIKQIYCIHFVSENNYEYSLESKNIRITSAQFSVKFIIRFLYYNDTTSFGTRFWILILLNGTFYFLSHLIDEKVRKNICIIYAQRHYQCITHKFLVLSLKLFQCWSALFLSPYLNIQSITETFFYKSFLLLQV